MRMPRVRFTLRWLMVAVVVLAALCYGEALRRRRARFREIAASHASSEGIYARMAGRAQKSAEMIEGDISYTVEDHMRGEPEGTARNRALEEAREWRAKAAEERGWARRHGELRRKYERAARYPWLPVATDPPAPPAPLPPSSAQPDPSASPRPSPTRRRLLPPAPVADPPPEQLSPSDMAIPDLPAEAASPFDKGGAGGPPNGANPRL